MQYDAGTQSAEYEGAAKGRAFTTSPWKRRPRESGKADPRARLRNHQRPRRDPGKFRAPGGTVCEIVPRRRYRKPAEKIAAGGDDMESGTPRSGDFVAGVPLALLGIYIVAQACSGKYRARKTRRRFLRCGTASPSSRCPSCSSRPPSRGRRGAAIGRLARTGRALSVWLALAVSVALFKVLGFVRASRSSPTSSSPSCTAGPADCFCRGAGHRARLLLCVRPWRWASPLPAGTLGF